MLSWSTAVDAVEMGERDPESPAMLLSAEGRNWEGERCGRWGHDSLVSPVLAFRLAKLVGANGSGSSQRGNKVSCYLGPIDCQNA